jgi:hypothetical protein
MSLDETSSFFSLSKLNTSSPLEDKYNQIKTVIYQNRLKNEVNIPKTSKSLMNSSDNIAEQIKMLTQQLNDYEKRIIISHDILSTPLEDLFREEEIVMTLEDKNEDLQIKFKNSAKANSSFKDLEKRIKDLMIRVDKMERNNITRLNKYEMEQMDYLNEVLEYQTSKIKEILNLTYKISTIQEENECFSSILNKITTIKSSNNIS